MHPSHVPLKGKAKAAVFGIMCYQRPCGRFLGNYHGSLSARGHDAVQMAEKFNSFQILVITIFVGNPLPLFLSIIEIKHGCNRINTDSINMELTDPE